MSRSIRLIIPFLVILLSGCTLTLHAQPENASIHTDWKALIRERHDLSHAKLIVAAWELCQQDTQTIRTILESIGAIKLPAYAQKRLDFLKAFVFLYRYEFNQQHTVPATLEKLLAEAYIQENSGFAVFLLELLSGHHAYQYAFAQSVAYAQMSLNLLRRQEGYSKEKESIMMMHLGNLYYWSFHDDSARVILENVLHSYESVPQSSLNPLLKRKIMEGYNALGLCYEKLGQYDTALATFDKGIQLAELPGQAFYKTLMEGNKGDVYFHQGRYDEAEPLLRADYEHSIRQKETANAANSLQWLGRIQVIRGHPGEGLVLIRRADSLLSDNGFEEFNMRVFTSYHLAFASLGMPDSAAWYKDKAQHQALLLERLKTENQITIVNLLLDQQKQLRHSLALQAEKKRIELIRNFSLGLLAALGIAGFLYINRLQLKSKHKQLQATMAITAARQELDQFTSMMRDKNQLIESLQQQLMHKEHDALRIERIQELSQLTMLTNEDWDRFKVLFSQVYPGFFQELLARVPDVSQAEMRMAALIRLRMSTREAAKLLGISENSVRKTRYRLRDRLGLHDEKDLFRFLHKVEDAEEEHESDSDR